MPFLKYVENWILLIVTFLVIAGVTFRIFKPAPKIPKHDKYMKFVYALIAIQAVVIWKFLELYLNLSSDFRFVLLCMMSTSTFQCAFFIVPCIVVIYVFTKEKITRKQKIVATTITISLVVFYFYLVNHFHSNYEPFDLYIKF